MPRKNIDAGRLAAIAARPGIDTRIWLSLAFVTDVGFDRDEGCFADVTFSPTGERETCYFGSSYAGGGFGDHCPIAVGDTVLVAVPSGDPGNGPIVIARFNNRGDPPHVDFGAGAEPTKDRVLRVAPGQRYILRTTDGDVLIEGEGAANARLAAGGDVEIVGSGSVSVAAETGGLDASAAQGKATVSGALGLDLEATAGPVNVTASAALSLAAAQITMAAGGAGSAGPGALGISAAGTQLGGAAATLSAAVAELTMADFAALKVALVAAFTAVGVGVSANGPAGAAIVAAWVPASVASTTVKVSP